MLTIEKIPPGRDTCVDGVGGSCDWTPRSVSTNETI